MSDHPNPPAFPVPAPVRWENGARVDAQPGMSLRDWFAGQALAGLCANRAQVDTGADVELRGAAMQAYVAADAMLAERTKATGGQHD